MFLTDSKITYTGEHFVKKKSSKLLNSAFLASVGAVNL
jgi:hypothetical protein